MPSSCKDIREALAQCLLNSDCVLIEHHTPAECLRTPELASTLPQSCQHLRYSYGQCKRGLIDMRKRFRGNKPILTKTEQDAGGGLVKKSAPAPMLYAGGSVVQDPGVGTVKEQEVGRDRGDGTRSSDLPQDASNGKR